LLETFVFFQKICKKLHDNYTGDACRNTLGFSRRAPFILARLYPKCNCT